MYMKIEETIVDCHIKINWGCACYLFIVEMDFYDVPNLWWDLCTIF